MMTSRTCRKPDERLVAAVYDECARRAETAPSDCQGSLERMYACAGRALACSEAIPTDPAGVDCSAEERGYAECVSGGTCSRSGGGQYRSPTPDLAGQTGDSGICPAPDRVCALTAERCAFGAS